MKLFLFHLIGLTVSAWSLYVHYIHVDLNPQVKRGYGGEWRYLTYINLNVQFVIFTLCVLQDILMALSFNVSGINKIKNVKDLLYISVAYPLCLFVLSTFWIIYAIDRELILPVSMDSIVPYWTNNVFHTYIVITLALSLTDQLEYPNKKKGLILSSLFIVSYIVWISFLFTKTNSWPYPIMNVLSSVQLFIFISFCIIAFLLFYLIGDYLNDNTSAKGNLKKKEMKPTRRKFVKKVN